MPTGSGKAAFDLGHIFDISPDLLCILDLDHNIIRANHAMAEKAGLPHGSLAGSRCFLCAHQTATPPDFCVHSQMLADGQPHHAEMFLEHLGGWYTVSVTPLYDELGELAGSFHAARNLNESKSTEKGLREMNDKFIRSQRIAHIGNWTQCLATGELTWSGEMYRILGFPQNDPIGILDASRVFPPEELERFKKAVHAAIHEDIPYSIDYRIIRPDGTRRYIHDEGEVVRDENGEATWMFGTTQDVTDRMQIEEALYQERYLMSALMDNVPDHIYFKNLDSRFFRNNRAHLQSFGFEDPAMVTGKSDFDFFTPEAARRQYEDEQEIIRTGKPMTKEEFTIRNDGSVNCYNATKMPLRDRDGRIIGTFGISRDITRSKLAEEALLKNEERYKKTQELGHVGSWEYDLSSNSFWGSDEGKHIYGFDLETDLFTAEEVMNRVIDRGPVDQALTDLIEHDKPYDIEFDIMPLNSTGKRTIHSIAEIIRDEQGRPVRVTGSLHDITRQKQVEAELIVAKEKAEESDRLKSAFLANMSHEIRTPMNGILGFTELLKEPNLTGEEQQKYIRIIEKSGDRLLTIINNLLDISKIESGQVELDIRDSNVNEQLEFLYTFFMPEVVSKGLKFSYSYSLPASESVIQTDTEKLYAILTNLVKNAVKFTDSGSITYGYERKGPFLEFFVKDTGTGIPGDRQEAIFERFIQADISDKGALQGAGLGLSISRAYVEMLGGTMWVESEYENGSAFYFTIPYLTKPAAHPLITGTRPGAALGDPAGKLNVLIAEDDDTSALFLQQILKNYSLDILQTDTGAGAVEICRNTTGLDLILMDIKMPVMDGYEATRQIRKFNKQVIIIAQTGFALSGDKELAIEAGCNEYIAKPLNVQLLNRILSNYFH